MSAADHFRAVYRDGVDDYQRLVQHEDAAGLLWRLLDELVAWRDLDVVELGAGTGRVTVPLAQRARHVHAIDASPHMLDLARRRLTSAQLTNVAFHVAEHRDLPLADHEADALIEGWAVAHYVDWEPDTWRSAVDACVAEMRRVVRAGGPIVLIETLGTGVTEPTPPTAELDALYAHLESAHGFVRHWVRTDYRFPDVASAHDTVTRFFGDEMAQRLDGASLAECTGVWIAVA
jgi:ubiquinone/menaquinone biosynthesis C-methylase UbiE